jgi:hypothetical protein
MKRREREQKLEIERAAIQSAAALQYGAFEIVQELRTVDGGGNRRARPIEFR